MSSPSDQNKPSDIVLRSSGLPPNSLRSSGVVSREQLYLERQQQVRLNAERQKALEQQRKAAATQRKRSGGGSIPSWLSASRAKKKKAEQEAAAAEEKAAKKAQKKAERETVFEAFRSSDKAAQAEGKDLTKATFKITKDTKTIDELKAEGIDISSLGKDVKGNTKVTVSSIKGSGFKGVLFGSEAKSNKQGRSGKDLRYEYVNPDYNLKFGSQRIGDIVSSEAAKGDKGIYGSRSTFDPKAVTEFIAGYRFYQDVKRGKGASDDVIYTPKAGLLGKAGVYEGADDFGFYRTMIIKPSISKSTIQKPLSRAEQIELEIPKDDLFGGFGNDYKNIGTTFYTGLLGAFAPQEVAKWQLRKETAPKIEPEFGGEFTSEVVIKSFINKKSNKNLYDFSQTVSKRPLYFTGSLLAEASLWINPFTLPVKIAGLAAKAPAIVSKVGRAGSLTTDLLKVGKGANTFKAIQAERSTTSIYKYWIDFGKKDDVLSLAREFDQANPPSIGKFKPDSFGLDEVRITKEFERSPTEFRFIEERRPAVIGQKIPLTIEEELGLVKLNPDKPRSTALRPSDAIRKDLLITDVKAVGSPFKQTGTASYTYKPPKLGDIMRSNLWTGQAAKTSGAPFKLTSSRNLPKLSDIMRSPSALWSTEAEARLGAVARAERSVFSTVTPSGKKVKKLSDLMPSASKLWGTEKEARLADVARSEASTNRIYDKSLPKLSDILRKDLFKPRKQKGGGLLSEKAISDLLDTLEGKKALEPARNLLTRKEQGRLAGDMLDDLTPSKKGKGLEKIADDLFKPTKKARKKKDDDLGTIEKAISGSGSTGQTTVLIAKSRVSSSGGEFPTLDLNMPTPKGYAAPKLNFNFGSLSLAKSMREQKEATRSVEQIITTPKGSLLGGIPTSRLDLSKITGLRINIAQTTRQQSRQATRIDTGLRRATKVNLDFGFKFDMSLKPITTAGQKYRFKQFNDTPTPTRIVPRLNIPTVTRTPIKTLKLELPKGFLKTNRIKSGKGKGRQQQRTFLVPDLPSAFLGTKNPFAKAFKKRFDKLY